MGRIAFWNRLSVRLGLLLLLMVLILEGSSFLLLNNLLSDADTNLQAARIASGNFQTALINLAVIVLLTLLGATFFARTLLVEPIMRLVEATKEISAGNFGVTLPVDSDSELGLLALAFNNMSRRIALNNEHLLAVNQELLAVNEALRSSEASHRLVIQGANDGVWEWNPQSNQVDFSSRWKAMLGYSDNELSNELETWWSHVHPNDVRRLQNALKQHILEDEKLFSHEYRMRCKDGSYIWVLSRATTLRDAHNNVLRMAGSQTDISQRVNALQISAKQVEERTEQLSVLLDVANTIAVTLELEPLLDTILTKLKKVVDYTAASVFSLQPSLGENRAGYLELLYYQGEADVTRLEKRWDLDEAHEAANALQQRRPHVIHEFYEGIDVTKTFRQLVKSYMGTIPMGMTSWLGLPLIVRDKVVGLLALEHRESNYYNGARQDIAMAFASQVGVALENIRLYAQAQQDAALEERRHLARELHDSVSQALYAIAMGSQTANLLLQRQPDKLDKISERLSFVAKMSQAGQAEMRALIFELRPESLEQEGLSVALKKQVEALEARYQLKTGKVLQVSFHVPQEPAIPFEKKQALYRITQEALHNIAKHAAAKSIHLQLLESASLIELSIRDDGKGFDLPRKFNQGGPNFPGHLGLVSMRERAEAIGARFIIDSEVAMGTTLFISLPKETAQDRLEASHA